MRAADHPGGERGGASVGELVDEAGLPGQDQGQVGLGVLVELTEGVQLGEDLQAQKRGLVDDECHFHLFGPPPARPRLGGSSRVKIALEALVFSMPSSVRICR